MDYTVECFEHAGVTVKILPDEDPTSPREWDNLGKMICWHRRYRLGDEHSFEYPENLIDELAGDAFDKLDRWFEREYAKLPREGTYPAPKKEDDKALRAAFRRKMWEAAEKEAIILPLYLYDHSGLRINTSGFSCPWDSGQVGYIYVTLTDVRKEYGCKRITKKVREQAEQCLRGEVEDYDDYLSCAVYGYVIEGGEEEGEMDSCWGFYGLDYCIQEAKSAAESCGKVVATRKARDLEESRPDMYA